MGLLDKKNIDSLEKNNYPRFIFGLDDKIMKNLISDPKPGQPWGILSYMDFPQIYPIVPEHVQRE